VKLRRDALRGEMCNLTSSVPAVTEAAKLRWGMCGAGAALDAPQLAPSLRMLPVGTVELLAVERGGGLKEVR